MTVSNVATIAALSAASIVGLTDGQPYVVSNYAVDGDGGGGTFIWNSSSVAPSDLGTCIAPSSLITSASGVAMATGNGSKKTFNGTFTTFGSAFGGIIPQTVTITAGSVVATDNGGGILGGTGVSGTINYTTGAWTLAYTTAPANALAITGAYQYSNAAGKYLRQLSNTGVNAAWFNVNPGNLAAVNTNNIATALYYNSVLCFGNGTFNANYIVVNAGNCLIGEGPENTILNCSSSVSNAVFVDVAAFGATITGTDSSRLYDIPLQNLQLTTGQATTQGLIGVQVNTNLTSFANVVVDGFNIGVQLGTTNVFDVLFDACTFINNLTNVQCPAIVSNSGELIEFRSCWNGNSNILFDINDTGSSQWEVTVIGGALDYPNNTFINYNGPQLNYITIIGAHIEWNSNPPYFLTSTQNNFGGGCINLIGCFIVEIYPNFTNQTAQATFSASCSGTVLTVTGSPTGTLKVGSLVAGNTHQFLPNTQIVSFGTGSGGAGTYNVSQSQSVASQSGVTTLDPANAAAFNFVGCRAVLGGFNNQEGGFTITDSGNFYNRTAYAHNSQFPQNFTPVSGTTYNNSSPSVIKVSVPVTFTPTGAAAATVSAAISTGSGFYNGFTYPTMSYPAGGATGIVQIYSFDVPPGASYVITGSHVTLGSAAVSLF